MAPPATFAGTTLHVTLQVAPSNIEPFLAALRPVWEACSREPECVFFDIFHSEKEPGKFRFVEVWTKDEKWFLENQITKPYYEPYLAVTMPMWVADRQMEFFDRTQGWNYVDSAYLAKTVRT